MVRIFYSWMLLSLITIFGHFSLLTGWNLTNPHEFIRKHSLSDPEIKKFLDDAFAYFKTPEIALRWAGCKFLRDTGKIIAIHPRIPDYLIKAINYEHESFFDKIIRTFHRNRNICRIYINEKIQECIKKYNLKYITTPQKYLYHIPGLPDDLSDANYMVLAQRMDILCPQCNRHHFTYHATDEQKKEVVTVIKEIGYGDSHLENICFLKDGSGIAFIDTEPHGTVDLFTIFPGFQKAVHSLSANVGQGIFKKEHQRIIEKEEIILGEQDEEPGVRFSCQLCNRQSLGRWISNCCCNADPYGRYFFPGIEPEITQ